ncbi:PKD domain-containing protein [Pseudodonghicola xiamenensis]|uniref:PKD domain-containing protein n=1 Tax=Pseudodonghicola xiamenensis TaxID=337702 RepID=A0A8J3H6F7_9RHOB|nr:PKD domain-containing protein [Pseudodonghicola xiamenensis]GHG84394.1 hypothetical protein GCM10010961_10400 [Pseudodonghicola xiamenensis]
MQKARIGTGALLALMMLVEPSVLPAQSSAGAGTDAGLLVVYGRRAPSREGDIDHLEEIFFSLPADLADPVYLRLYDPETGGRGDFPYGGGGGSETTFRLFGGEGAFSAVDRPQPVADGARAGRQEFDPAPGPGKLIREKIFGSDPATDGRWATLTALHARQGEVIGDRAYFRLDVLGTEGYQGNGYSVSVSLQRDSDRPPEGLEMFSYQATVRWAGGEAPTLIGFKAPGDGPLTVQNFDGASADFALVTRFGDLPLKSSGQDYWVSDQVETPETDLALSFSGGFETPNDVTVSVFDADGQALPLTMPPLRAPVPARPVAQGTARPLADCRAVAFDASGTTGRAPLSYLWNFGDGESSPEPVIVHRYAAPGRYTARLEVLEPGSRPGRGAALELPVHVRNAPIAVPGGDIVVAPGQAVAFDGSASEPSDSPITRYLWNFGDGAEARGIQASHSYAAPGQFRAVLRVEDDSDHPCNFGVETRRVLVNFPPVAEAGADQQAVVGQNLSVSAGASYDIDGLIDRYIWDMGDGTELDGKTVTHAYGAPGLYTVTLTVVDDSGVANARAQDHLQIAVNAPPVPAFTPPLRALSVSEAAVLDATASVDPDGQILSYIWDFGDGATGEGPVVNYAWTRAGEFPVTLTVIDNSGTASALQSVTRTVRVDAAPVADAGPDQFVTASVVHFDGSGSSDPDGEVAAWAWDFGDGTTGEGERVDHVYARPGVYHVALSVTDDSGAPLNRSRDSMVVTVNASPIADAGPARTVAPGAEFTLSAAASVDPDGQIAKAVWQFPDGSTAEGERVSHRLDKPGLYPIGLTVYDDFAGGAASASAEVLITVNAAPVAMAGPDLHIAPGDSVIFDGGASYDPDGKIVSWRWDFDDLGAPLEAARVERAYTAPGVWSAQLTVTDDSGVLNATASDAVTIRVNSPPVADAGPAVESESLYVTLDGGGSADADGDSLIYLWDFGDGSDPVAGQRVTHVYPQPGFYPVTLSVDDGSGLSNARTSDATTVRIKARPVAVAGGNRDVCSGQPILFDASGSSDPDGGSLLYAWDFGDGESSDLINPTKIFEKPGVYPVTLRVRNESGTDYGTDMDRIAALVRQGPMADAGPDLKVCANTLVRFDGSGSSDADGAVNAFAWDFGDGATGAGATPAHTFSEPGHYSVTLTITGDALGSCSPLDTDMVEVEVVPAPELAIDGPSRAGAGAGTAFAARLSGAGEEGVSSILWDFGDGATAEGAEATHTWTEPGSYDVTLRVALSGGAEACGELEMVHRVVVNAAPVALFTGPEDLSVGQSARFDASGSTDADGALVSYDWDFGDGATAQGVMAEHSYAAPGEYLLRLSVLDDAGVGNSLASMTRKIKVAPVPQAALAAPAPACPGQPISWTLATAPEAAASWRFGDGKTAEGNEVSHAYDHPGLYPLRVILDDGAGLAGSRSVEEIYQRVNVAPVAQAGPDRLVCPGDSIVFDAGGSFDPDGAIDAFEWVFSDGITLSGARVERSFDSPGALEVRLNVRDDSGAAACNHGSDSARVLVNAPPVVDAGPDRRLFVGGAHDDIMFDAAIARDPEGQGLSLSWDFGDGATASGARVRHRYAVPGSYTVTVEARDATGLACGVARDTALVEAVPRSP